MHNLQDAAFFERAKLGKKTIRGRLVIPSGVRCARAAAIAKYFDIDSVGVITTKSISVAPKKGYLEPIYAGFANNSYINAVGLENPGAEIFRSELAQIIVPDNKFLLVSIFGGDADSFYAAAEILADYADGFELNMSCPHAKGYGLQVGSDIELVSHITRKIVENFDIPVFVKLSGAIPGLASTAAAAINCGAYGITATNSIGPSVEYVDGTPVLSNVYGGMSGEAIRPLGLKAICDIRGAIGQKPVIIGMGGIFDVEHIKSYNSAGADFFGIGSALTGLTTSKAAVYLNSLESSLLKRQTVGFRLPPSAEDFALQPEAEGFILPPSAEDMRYRKCRVESNDKLTDALHKIKFSEWEGYHRDNDVAGKFFFIMIPETGEKPFSIYSNSQREFIVKNIGRFTKALTGLKPGDELFIRGPYGSGIDTALLIGLTSGNRSVINLVAGGTGISPVYEIAKKCQNYAEIRFFLGGGTAGDIFDLEKYKALGEVYIATEDGSLGQKGRVTDLLTADGFSKCDRQVFINVGPKAMIAKCYEIEREITDNDDIWVSIEYQTSCGVGICGKCATDGGVLSCVDGPFLRVADALRIDKCKHN